MEKKPQELNVIKKKNQYLGDNVKEFQNTCYLVYDVPTQINR